MRIGATENENIEAQHTSNTTSPRSQPKPRRNIKKDEELSFKQLSSSQNSDHFQPKPRRADHNEVEKMVPQTVNLDAPPPTVGPTRIKVPRKDSHFIKASSYAEGIKYAAPPPEKPRFKDWVATENQSPDPFYHRKASDTGEPTPEPIRTPKQETSIPRAQPPPKPSLAQTRHDEPTFQRAAPPPKCNTASHTDNTSPIPLAAPPPKHSPIQMSSSTVDEVSPIPLAAPPPKHSPIQQQTAVNDEISTIPLAPPPPKHTPIQCSSSNQHDDLPSSVPLAMPPPKHTVTTSSVSPHEELTSSIPLAAPPPKFCAPPHSSPLKEQAKTHEKLVTVVLTGEAKRQIVQASENKRIKRMTKTLKLDKKRKYMTWYAKEGLRLVDVPTLTVHPVEDVEEGSDDEFDYGVFEPVRTTAKQDLSICVSSQNIGVLEMYL